MTSRLLFPITFFYVNCFAYSNVRNLLVYGRFYYSIVFRTNKFSRFFSVFVFFSFCFVFLLLHFFHWKNQFQINRSYLLELFSNVIYTTIYKYEYNEKRINILSVLSCISSLCGGFPFGLQRFAVEWHFVEEIFLPSEKFRSQGILIKIVEQTSEYQFYEVFVFNCIQSVVIYV